MNIEHLSVSRHDLWKECQQKYKFKYHLKIKIDEPEKPYFMYGKVVHKIFEEYTLAKGEKSLSAIAKNVLDGNILLEDNQPDQKIPREELPNSYLKRLPKHLEAFSKVVNSMGFSGHTEYEFEYDLDPPNKKLVYGFIDRLIFKKDHIFILDYKTTQQGPYRKDKFTIMKDLQLQCYALIAMKQFKVPAKNIHTTLYYLDDEEMIGATFSEQTLLAAEAKLLSVYNDIQALHEKDAKGYVGKHCQRCDYRKICPFYSLIG